MKRRLFFAGLVISFLFLISIHVAAEEKQRSSWEVQTDIEILNYAIQRDRILDLENGIDTIETQMDGIQQEKSEAELNEDYQSTAQIDDLLSYYINEIESIKQSLNQIKYEQDVQYYYVANEDMILTEEDIKSVYQLYCCKQQVKVLDAQIIYCQAQKSELEQRKIMEQAKYGRGYAVQADVLIIENQISILQLEEENLKNEKEFQLMKIFKWGSEYVENEIDDELPELRDGLVEIFVEKDSQIKSYDQQIRAFQNYLDDLDETDGEYLWIMLQKEQLESKKREYIAQLELHVAKLIKDYENAKREVKEYVYQMENVEMLKRNNELLYEKGQIAKADLLGFETELVRLEVERRIKISAAQILFFELDHGMVLSQ